MFISVVNGFFNIYGTYVYCCNKGESDEKNPVIEVVYYNQVSMSNFQFVNLIHYV